MKKTVQRTEVYLFSPWLRIFHWVMVLSVFTLFLTGLYIGNPPLGALPGQEPTTLVGSIFSMEIVRKIHFIAAFLLTISLIMRIFGGILNKGDRLLAKFWKKSFWEGLIWGVKHYLFFPTDHREYARNSLARLSYTLVYFLLIFMVITGFAMYTQIYPQTFAAGLFAPINHFFTEYRTHYVHHIGAWICILFFVIHLYLAFRADMVEHNGEISSMFSGVKYFSVDPHDLDDLVTDKKEAAAIRNQRFNEVMRYKNARIAKKQAKRAE